MRKESHLKIYLVAFRNDHHMANSGYARMTEVIRGQVIEIPRHLNLFQRVLTKGLAPLAVRSGSQWYHRRQLLAELIAAIRWLRHGRQIFHFLYGENSYRYLGILKTLRRDNHIICTFHTPPEKFQMVVRNRNHLRRIDAAIVFSQDQAAFFSELIGAERVFHVPHGVDVVYFKPADASPHDKDHFRCLFVGQHLRDFTTLAAGARHLAKESPGIRFSVVTPKDKHHYFGDLDNVDLYSGIPDQELLALYRGSDLFVAPLLETTANCAVQEAMACGLPVVATDLPAVREYADDACALLVPHGDAFALKEAVLRLYRDDALRLRMAAASRRKAEEYSLEAVAAKTLAVYAKVANS